MRARKLDWFPWYAEQFARETCGWTFAERSVYRALLDVQWRVGVVPLQAARIAAEIHCSAAVFAAAWPKVRTKFRRKKGGWIDDGLEAKRQLGLRLYRTRVESINERRDPKSGRARS